MYAVWRIFGSEGRNGRYGANLITKHIKEISYQNQLQEAVIELRVGLLLDICQNSYLAPLIKKALSFKKLWKKTFKLKEKLHNSSK